jgi:5-methylcytosine-specific restriction protein A
MPEWGYGLVRTVSGKKLDILFEHGGRRLLRRDFASLEDVDPANIAEDSPLNDRKQWRRLETQKAFRAEFGRMLNRFLEIFPQGFADEDLAANERDDKLKAIAYAQEHLTAEAIAATREEGGDEAVFETILAAVDLTTLIHPRLERSKLAGIPEDERGAVIDAFINLLHGEEEYARRLTDFYKVVSEYGAGKWTICSYFGFIFQPEAHPFVRPADVRYAAKALKQEIHYAAQLNPRTLRAIEQLYIDVRDRLLVEGQAPADTIDIQTFLWVGGPGYDKYREWRDKKNAESGIAPTLADPKPAKKKRKKRAAASKPAATATPEKKVWSDQERFDAVEAYFWMQEQEKQARKFDRNALYATLESDVLKGHTSQEIRRIMLHISAALIDVNRPHLEWLAAPTSPDAEMLAALIPLVRARLTDAWKLRAPTADHDELLQRSHTIATERGQPRAPAGRRKPEKTTIEQTTWKSDPAVRAWVLNRANNCCEGCGDPALYTDPLGTFFKLFRLQPFAEGGTDTIENTAALCPNCYQLAEYGPERTAFLERLCNRVPELMRQ